MKKSFVPLYQRIQEKVRAEFLAGAPADGMERLPSERDLQARYGVSRPTISKALAALAAEGYVARTQGRGSFAVQRHAASDPGPKRHIGYIAPLSDAPLVQRAFRGIDRVGSRAGYRILLSSAGWSVERERAAVEDLIATGVRGLVIYPVPRLRTELATDYLTTAELPVPVVLVDTPVPAQGHTQVVFDNRRAGYAMTSWLIGRGCRRIAVLGCMPQVLHGSLLERREGYRQALLDHGIPVEQELERGVDMRDKAATIEAALEAWFRLPNPPDAIIAADDVAALEAIDMLASCGLRVPEDVRVVGFDNREVARRHRPAFATTNPDFERLGELACELLIDAIDGMAVQARIYVLEVPLLTRRGADGATLDLPPGAAPRVAVAAHGSGRHT